MIRTIALLLLAACGSASSDGDAGPPLEPIPGGYPLAERSAGALQARLAPSGVATLAGHAADLVACAMPGGIDLCIAETASAIVQIFGFGFGDVVLCTGSTGEAAWCAASAECAVHAEVTGVSLTPVAGADTIAAEIRLTAWNTDDHGGPAAPLIASISFLGTHDCTILIDTTDVDPPTIGFPYDVVLAQDPATGYTRVELAGLPVTDLDNGDIHLSGDWACTAMDWDWLKGMIVGQITGGLTGMAEGALTEQLCEVCPAGTCPQGASCNGDGICELGDGGCLQALGVEGRLVSGDRAVDLLVRAGGAAWAGQATDQGGVSLAAFAGARAAAHDPCVPALAPPAVTDVPPDPVLVGDAPGAAAHDFALAVHRSILDRLGFAAWDAGLLCLDVGQEATTAMRARVFEPWLPSLAELTHGEDVPMRLVLRPQRPPAFSVGAGSFTPDGGVLDPLLVLGLEQVVIELHAELDDRPVRVLALDADLAVPLSLRVDAEGRLNLVAGATDGAVTRLDVVDSALLAESADEITVVLRNTLAIVLGVAGEAVGPIALPGIGCEGNPIAGLDLRVPAGGVSGAGDLVTVLGVFATPVAKLAPLPSPSGRGGGGEGGGGEGGCAVGGGASLGLALLPLLLALGRRRLLALLLLLAACRSSSPIEHLDGGGRGMIVYPGPIGRGAALAAGPDGTLRVSAYEERYGDLVVGEIGPAPERRITWEIVDGVPAGAHPAGAAASWRGGVTEAGDDVGSVTSLAHSSEGAVLVAYRGRAPDELRFAARAPGGAWATHVVDARGGAGRLLSLAVDGQGRPAIAYLAPAVVDPASGVTSGELRLARATTALPAAAGDWSITVVDGAPVPCAGLCAAPEVCAAELGACVLPGVACPPCADDEIRHAGACTARAAAPRVDDLPRGTGLWPNLLFDGDGAPLIVYHDRAAGDLRVAIGRGAGFELLTLDAAGVTGVMPSALLDPDGVLHVAYADAGAGALVHLSTTLTAGVTPTREVLDVRAAGATPHAVGLGAELVIDGSARLRVLYQDELLADLWEVRPGLSAPAALREGPVGAGFWTSATRSGAGAVFVHYRYDRGDGGPIPATAADAVAPRAHGPGVVGDTFGWLEVGELTQ